MNQLPLRSVALHIGAHKTATTHLQRSLGMQQEALIKAGVRYYGPDMLRRPKRSLGDVFGLEACVCAPSPTRSRAEQADFMFKDGHRLILSDENFVGVLHNKHGGILSPLYPMAAARVQDLATAIDAGPIDVFIGVRNPASFLISAYGQALLGGNLITFDDYITRNPLAQIYWPGLVARLSQCSAVGRIFVWQYEDYRWRFHKICAAMMGEAVDMRIVPIAEHVNRGLSAAAVQHVLDNAQSMDAQRLGDQARKAFPVSDTCPAFTPFSDEALALADQDYATQLRDIAAIEGVTVLGP